MWIFSCLQSWRLEAMGQMQCDLRQWNQNEIKGGCPRTHERRSNVPKSRGNRNVQHWPMRRYPLDFELRKMRELRYLGKGTSDHGNKKWRPLLNTKYPQKPGITHLRNHFWPIEIVFLAIAMYKNCFLKCPQ